MQMAMKQSMSVTGIEHEDLQRLNKQIQILRTRDVSSRVEVRNEIGNHISTDAITVPTHGESSLTYWVMNGDLELGRVVGHFKDGHLTHASRKVPRPPAPGEVHVGSFSEEIGYRIVSDQAFQDNALRKLVLLLRVVFLFLVCRGPEVVGEMFRLAKAYENLMFRGWI